MLEFLTIPVAIAAVAFLPKKKDNDRKNIKLLFER